MKSLIIIFIVLFFIIQPCDNVVSIVINEDIYLNVIPQPKDDINFVPNESGKLSQFELASQYGSIGLLAHSNLEGKTIDTMKKGDIIAVYYENNFSEKYKVSEILLYYALSPESQNSNFINLNHPDVILSGWDVFKETYGIPERLVFQTCMSVNGIDTWGRIFVIADKISIKKELLKWREE